MNGTDFTKGKLVGPLIRFALPVLFAMFLQSLYGAVDLLIVGQFADAANVSAVSTGAQSMQTVTAIIMGLSMGVTILMGQQMGSGRRELVGKTVGAAIAMFGVIALIFTILVAAGAGSVACVMNAPTEAMDQTVAYIRICACGSVFIVAFNVLGSVFRGIGNARMPLITVAIASVTNIFGDLALVAGLHLGAAGAAIATVAAQCISVVLSILIIRRSELPFTFNVREDIRFNKTMIRKIAGIGFPLALQDFLVNISFMFIIAIVNTLGVNASAGAGVASRLSGFIMLVPIAFMQSIAAIVSQNYGAGKMDRAIKALGYGIGCSITCGVLLFYAAFFHGDLLAGIFSKEPEVIYQAFDYLKGYAIDVLLTSFMFCFSGFFNGVGRTRLVMIQGIIGGVCIRIPLSFLLSRIQPVTLFHIGLATPCSTAVQIVIFLVFFIRIQKENSWYGKPKRKAI